MSDEAKSPVAMRPVDVKARSVDAAAGITALPLCWRPIDLRQFPDEC